MSTWLSIATGTTCTIVTVVGLLLSIWAWRAKGWRSGMRGVAWSLLPVVMYLTGAIRLVGRIGSAIVAFSGSFVFSPRTGLGVIFFFLAVLLFLLTGGIPLLQGGRRRAQKRQARQRAREQEVAAPAAGSGPPIAPASRSGAEPAVPGEDFTDVEEILRRRGIK